MSLNIPFIHTTLWTRDGKIKDLQAFMTTAYDYWRHRGSWNAIQNKLIDFLNAFFVSSAVYVLLFLVNWELLMKCDTEACIASYPKEQQGVLLPINIFFPFSSSSSSFQHSFFYSLIGVTVFIGCLAQTAFEAAKLFEKVLLQVEMQRVAKGFVRGGSQSTLKDFEHWLVRIRFSRKVAASVFNSVMDSRERRLERLRRSGGGGAVSRETERYDGIEEDGNGQTSFRPTFRSNPNNTNANIGGGGDDGATDFSRGEGGGGYPASPNTATTASAGFSSSSNRRIDNRPSSSSFRFDVDGKIGGGRRKGSSSSQQPSNNRTDVVAGRGKRRASVSSRGQQYAALPTADDGEDEYQRGDYDVDPTFDTIDAEEVALITSIVSSTPFLGGRAMQNEQLVSELRLMRGADDDGDDVRRRRGGGGNQRATTTSNTHAHHQSRRADRVISAFGVEVAGHDSDVEEDRRRRETRARRREYESLHSSSQHPSPTAPGPSSTAFFGGRGGGGHREVNTVDNDGDEEMRVVGGGDSHRNNNTNANANTRNPAAGGGVSIPIPSSPPSSTAPLRQEQRQNHNNAQEQQHEQQQYYDADDADADEDPFVLLDREEIDSPREVMGGGDTTHHSHHRDGLGGGGGIVVQSDGSIRWRRLLSDFINNTDDNPLMPHIDDIMWSDFLQRLCAAVRSDATALRRDLAEGFDELRAVQTLMAEDNFMIALHQPRVRGGETTAAAALSDPNDGHEQSPSSYFRTERPVVVPSSLGGGGGGIATNPPPLTCVNAPDDADEEGGIFRPHAMLLRAQQQHQQHQEQAREQEFEHPQGGGGGLEVEEESSSSAAFAATGSDKSKSAAAASRSMLMERMAGYTQSQPATAKAIEAAVRRGATDSPPPEPTPKRGFGSQSLSASAPPPRSPPRPPPPPPTTTIIIDPPIIKRGMFRFCDENVLKYLVSTLFDEFRGTCGAPFDYQHQQLKDTLLFLCIVSCLVYPFIVAVFTTRLVVKNIAAVKLKSQELVVGREWSPTAYWTFRLFNEVPHLTEARLRSGIGPARHILEAAMLPRPILRALQRFASTMIFLIVVVTFVNAAMLTIGMVFDRTLLWWLSSAFVLYSVATEPSRNREYSHLTDLAHLVRDIQFLSPVWSTSPTAFAEDITEVFLPSQLYGIIFNFGKILFLPVTLFYLYFVADGEASEVTMLVRFVRDNSEPSAFSSVVGGGGGGRPIGGSSPSAAAFFSAANSSNPSSSALFSHSPWTASCCRAANFVDRWQEATVRYCCGWDTAMLRYSEEEAEAEAGDGMGEQQHQQPSATVPPPPPPPPVVVSISQYFRRILDLRIPTDEERRRCAREEMRVAMRRGGGRGGGLAAETREWGGISAAAAAVPLPFNGGRHQLSNAYVVNNAYDLTSDSQFVRGSGGGGGGGGGGEGIMMTAQPLSGAASVEGSRSPNLCHQRYTQQPPQQHCSDNDHDYRGHHPLLPLMPLVAPTHEHHKNLSSLKAFAAYYHGWRGAVVRDDDQEEVRGSGNDDTCEDHHPLRTSLIALEMLGD